MRQRRVIIDLRSNSLQKDGKHDMTQVRHIARISKLKTNAIPIQTTHERKEMTPMTKKKLNPGFQKFLADRSDKAKSLRDILEVALAELEQPVSAAEMRFYLKSEGNMEINETVVKYALDQLAASGKVARHLESSAERKVRANGVPITPRPAHLFNSGPKARVRTQAVVVDGYALVDPRNNTGRPKGYKKKQSLPKGSLPKVYTSTQTGTISTGSPAKVTYTTQTGKSPFDTTAVDYLIDKIVEERTRDLQRQLDEAIAQLQNVKKILQS